MPLCAAVMRCVPCALGLQPFVGVTKVPDGWAAYVVVGDARLFAGNYPTKQQAALGYNAIVESLVIAGAWLRVRWCLVGSTHACVCA